jgi:hypothetical protein
MNRPRRLSFNRRKPNQRWRPCSGHLGWAAELIIERNLPLVTPNKPPKNRKNWPRRLSSNRRKPNPRWRPSLKSSLARRGQLRENALKTRAFRGWLITDFRIAKL